MVSRALLALLIVLAGALVGQPEPAAAELTGQEPGTIVLFWSEGCPHCHAEWQFLNQLKDEVPELEIVDYELSQSPENVAHFIETMTARGLEANAVPTTIVGEQVWVGFSDTVASQIRSAVTPSGPEPDDTADIVDIPVIGQVDAGSASLVASTFFIALVDGLNPCSLWVLSILLALVLRTGTRRRVLAIGGTFLLVTSVLYGVYIAGFYGALSFISHQVWIRAVLAVVVLTLGLINLRDYVTAREGFTLSIPERVKPGLYRRMRGIVAPSRTIGAALAGTALLAAGVSVVETPCTAGYPLLWADMLAAQDVGLIAAVPLFALYMAVFLIDELVVFAAAVIGMRALKLEERAGRLLKLFSGTVMVTLAGTLIFVPDAMSSLTGALAVFGIAVGAALIIAAMEKVWPGKTSDRQGSSQLIKSR
jgi:thiol-disulfide isomerase/thioredoxin